MLNALIVAAIGVPELIGERLQKRSDMALCDLMKKATDRTHSRHFRDTERFWHEAFGYINDRERSFREAILCGCRGCLEFAGAFK